MIATETVSLVRAHAARVWHILTPEADATLCRWQFPDDVVIELGLDAHVVQYHGKPVCSRCRQRLA
jgi:hypothetical protein